MVGKHTARVPAAPVSDMLDTARNRVRVLSDVCTTGISAFQLRLPNGMGRQENGECSSRGPRKRDFSPCGTVHARRIRRIQGASRWAHAIIESSMVAESSMWLCTWLRLHRHGA